MAAETNGGPKFAGRLARTRAAIGATIAVERGWPLVLPILLVISLFFSLSWLGLLRIVPDAARLILMAAIGVAILAALYPLRMFRKPTAAEIDRRIERANHLEHTPVLVQADRPSGKESAFATALWREHQRRMAAGLEGLGGDMPRTGVPDRDPWGLRALAGLLLVTAFAFSFGPLGGQLTDGFRPHARIDAVPARIDAWVTPPAYTGKAPLFLTATTNLETTAFSVPEQSDLALRVTGGSGKETLLFTDGTGAMRDLEPEGGAVDPNVKPTGQAMSAVRKFSGKLTTDGTLSLRSGEQELAQWSFTVIPDKPPVIRFSGDPQRAVNGALELTYEIEDDYGPVSAEAEITLDDPPGSNARPLYGAPDFPLTLPRRDAKGPAAKTSRDLTEHVWSGSNVRLTLKTRDAAGQEATSETRTILLPERPFTNPLAKAVVEHRKILSMDAGRKPDVVDLIDAVTLRPEDTFDNPSQFLGLMTGRTMLKMAASDDQFREVADYMWQMALAIENGDLSAAEKRLRQAQEAFAAGA